MCVCVLKDIILITQKLNITELTDHISADN